jgi:hypothetical protein
MEISSGLIMQICSFFGTIIAVVWYISNTLSNLKRHLSNTMQANMVQDKQLEQVQASVNECSRACKEGRVKLWEDVNNMKVQIAKLEATKQHEK